MNFNELKKEVEEVRVTINKLLRYLTDRTMEELKTKRHSREFSITDSDSYDWNHFLIFGEEAGIYLFEADFSLHYQKWIQNLSKDESKNTREEWFEEIKRIWSGVERSPSFYRNRAIHHYYNDNSNKFKNDWVPIYVGKSKNVNKRIYDHIEGMYPDTYGMKLSYREALMGDIKFRVSYSALDEIDDDIMFELVKVIENKVRYEFSPIFGKQ